MAYPDSATQAGRSILRCQSWPVCGVRCRFHWSRSGQGRVVVHNVSSRNRLSAGVGALDRRRTRWPTTPSCYAITGERRTESGRPAASIRFSTATPMPASVCWAAKPRARSRGPISACSGPSSFLLTNAVRSRSRSARPAALVPRSWPDSDHAVSADPVRRRGRPSRAAGSPPRCRRRALQSSGKWGGRRMHRPLPRLTKPLVLRWSALQEQISSQYQEPRHLKRKIEDIAGDVRAAYPQAKFDLLDGGISLHPSQQAVPKTLVNGCRLIASNE